MTLVSCPSFSSKTTPDLLLLYFLSSIFFTFTIPRSQAEDLPKSVLPTTRKTYPVIWPPSSVSYPSITVKSRVVCLSPPFSQFWLTSHSSAIITTWLRAAAKVMNGFLFATSSGKMYFSPYYAELPFEFDAKMEYFKKNVTSLTHLFLHPVIWQIFIEHLVFVRNRKYYSEQGRQGTLPASQSTQSWRVCIFLLLNWTK